MTEHRGLELGVVASFLVSVNWQATISVIVGILAGAYYLTRLYKEWFGGSPEQE